MNALSFSFLNILIALLSLSYEEDEVLLLNVSSIKNISKEDWQAAQQAYINVYNVSTISKENISSVLVPRCGKPGPQEPNPNQTIITPWTERSLKYKIVNVSESLTENELRAAMRVATEVLTSRINLQITEISSNDEDTAEILIQFAPQDGSGLTLGYASFPMYGDISIDSDENFSHNSSDPNKINLLWVMTHELGHAIGLDHSPDENSLMFAYYNLESWVTPVDQDILNNLYGIRRTEPDEFLCNISKIDDILRIGSNEEHWIMKGNLVWNMTAVGLQGNVSVLSVQFNDRNILTDGLDAAFSDASNYYFFKNESVYILTNNNCSIESSIRSVFKGLPDNLDAAFCDESRKRFLFFKGSFYYQVKSLEELAVVNSIAKDWPGVPDNVEAATLISEKAWFIKDGLAYVFDMTKKKLVDESPFNFRKKILKCPL